MHRGIVAKKSNNDDKRSKGCSSESLQAKWFDDKAYKRQLTCDAMRTNSDTKAMVSSRDLFSKGIRSARTVSGLFRMLEPKKT